MDMPFTPFGCAQDRLRPGSGRTADLFRGSLARQIFGGVQRFLERDPEAALEQHRQLALAPDDLEQLEVLRVARAYLDHHARWFSGFVQRLLDLVQVRVMSDLQDRKSVV